MAYLAFKDVGIAGLAAAVPSTVIDNYTYTEYFSEEAAREVVEKTGVRERRFADENTCASDLCHRAAQVLLDETGTDRSGIDLLLFVSQTPDHHMPATSVILQDRLGLSSSTMAFDINMGCSGFIYGLSVAHSFLQQEGIRKVLLLDGETRSKVYSPKDRTTAFIFGDAGVAALVDRDPRYGKSWFSLNSDGSRESLIKIDAGAYRIPSSLKTLEERVVDEYGNIRNMEQGYMNGPDVFNFLIREVPRDIRKLLAYASETLSAMDFLVFHQANSYINGYLTRKLKLDPQKVPSSIEKFGNTSSVSIPLTIVSELQGRLDSPRKVLLSGFGVGLTWASAILTLDHCHLSPITEL
jgi:3-oxoacyl-[acyl-carrier-protein] synthase-3